MRTVFIKKRFSQSPKMVYGLITKHDHVANWWGPEDVRVTDCSLKLGQIGPWSSTMTNEDGAIFHASGDVLQVKLLQSTKMTFRWTEQDGSKSPETFLTFEVVPRDDGETELLLTHEGFKTQESENMHQDGWSSAMRKLTKYIATIS